MKTFEHPKAWVYDIKSYHESIVYKLAPCWKEQICRKAYYNVYETCNGLRVVIMIDPDGGETDTICPCIIEKLHRKTLGPRNGVSFE